MHNSVELIEKLQEDNTSLNGSLANFRGKLLQAFNYLNDREKTKKNRGRVSGCSSASVNNRAGEMSIECSGSEKAEVERSSVPSNLVKDVPKKKKIRIVDQFQNTTGLEDMHKKQTKLSDFNLNPSDLHNKQSRRHISLDKRSTKQSQKQRKEKIVKKTQPKSKTNKTKSKKILKIEKPFESNDIKSQTFDNGCIDQTNIFYQLSKKKEKQKPQEIKKPDSILQRVQSLSPVVATPPITTTQSLVSKQMQLLNQNPAAHKTYDLIKPPSSIDELLCRTEEEQQRIFNRNKQFLCTGVTINNYLNNNAVISTGNTTRNSAMPTPRQQAQISTNHVTIMNPDGSRSVIQLSPSTTRQQFGSEPVVNLKKFIPRMSMQKLPFTEIKFEKQDEEFIDRKLLTQQQRQRVEIKKVSQSQEFGLQGFQINKIIQNANQFIKTTLRSKETNNSRQSQQLLQRLARFFGFKLSATELEPRFLNSKEWVSILKSKIFFHLNARMLANPFKPKLIQKRGTSQVGNQRLNQLPHEVALFQNKHGGSQIGLATAGASLFPKAKHFKFWVEKSGNNHRQVIQIIKRRSWLTQIDLEKTKHEEDPIYSGPFNSSLNQLLHQSKLHLAGVNVFWTQVKRQRIVKMLGPNQIYNHLDGIQEIGDKSSLYLTMDRYYKKNYIETATKLPETFLIPLIYQNDTYNQTVFEGGYREGLQQFKKAFQRDGEAGTWIYKPGENANQGYGIKIFNNYNKIEEQIRNDVEAERQEIDNLSQEDQQPPTTRALQQIKTIVLQKYIERPLLIHKRKFDIRVFALAVAHAETGLLRGYFYEEGYMRTSCKEYSRDKLDNKFVHLTNDAIQKSSVDYGKYESSNKVSYVVFEKLLKDEKNVSFMGEILPKIKALVTDVFNATGTKIYTNNKQNASYNGFELMGLDFMLDEELNLSLIEVNTNPCLDMPCLLLQRIILQLIDQTLKLAVDPFLSATENQYYMNQEFCGSDEIKYQQVYETQLPSKSD